jgi:hypothetical protein
MAASLVCLANELSISNKLMNDSNAQKMLREAVFKMGVFGSIGLVVSIVFALAQFPLDALGQAPIRGPFYYIGLFFFVSAPFAFLVVLSLVWGRWLAKKTSNSEERPSENQE